MAIAFPVQPPTNVPMAADNRSLAMDHFGMTRRRSCPMLAILLVSLLVHELSCTLAGSAAERWPEERQAGNFVCHADFSLQAYGQLLHEMSHLQVDLVRTLGIQASRERVHLFLFHQKSTYQAYMKQYFPSVPYRRALYIKGRGPGMVFAYHNRDFAIDVRHESTHALLHAALPLVPLWLDEGLAEYFEVPQSQRARGNAHLARVQWNARLGRVPSLTALESIGSLQEMDASQYRNAWAWVHFMLHGPPAAHQTLVAYLSDIQARIPPGTLSDRLRRRLPDLERQFRRHFAQWN